MLKVLFLCTENACRSQMAEGLINHDLAGLVKAFSGGWQLKRFALWGLAFFGIYASSSVCPF